MRAAASESPDRVRRLARDMRLRAAEIELAGQDELDLATRLFHDGAGALPTARLLESRRATAPPVAPY